VLRSLRSRMDGRADGVAFRKVGIGFEAGGAVAAYFGAGDGDFHVEVAGDLFLELLVEAAFEFSDFSTAEAGDVNVVAGAVAFVVVAVTAEVEQVELVDEALFFEQVDGAVNGDEVDAGIDFLRAGEDLVDVEVLLGVVHNLEDDAALLGHAEAALGEDLLELAGGFGGIEAFPGGDAARG
jgi:hypothetical protein